MTRVIPAILRSWSAVQVQVNPDPVLARPFDRSQEIPPADLADIRISFISDDGPISERYAYVVEACRLHLSEVLLGEEG